MMIGKARCLNTTSFPLYDVCLSFHVVFKSLSTFPKMVVQTSLELTLLPTMMPKSRTGLEGSITFILLGVHRLSIQHADVSQLAGWRPSHALDHCTSLLW